MKDGFLFDRNLGTIRRINLTNLEEEAVGISVTNFSLFPSISFDGRYVEFGYKSTNLSPSSSVGISIFRKDLMSNALIQVDTSSSSVLGDLPTTHGTMTVDGKFVAFASNSTNLDTVPGTPSFRQIYLKNIETNETYPISLTTSHTYSNNTSDFPDISNDGNFIVFESTASDLVLVDTNAKSDIF